MRVNGDHVCLVHGCGAWVCSFNIRWPWPQLTLVACVVTPTFNTTNEKFVFVSIVIGLAPRRDDFVSFLSINQPCHLPSSELWFTTCPITWNRFGSHLSWFFFLVLLNNDALAVFSHRRWNCVVWLGDQVIKCECTLVSNISYCCERISRFPLVTYMMVWLSINGTC